jgi:hypothetical protein
MTDRTGGCLCDQVRYRLAADPVDPSSIKPTANIWSASAPAWACLNPGLERIERQPLPPQPPQG